MESFNHPDGKDASSLVLASDEIPYFDPLIFSNIDEDLMAKTTLRTKGAAGSCNGRG